MRHKPPYDPCKGSGQDQEVLISSAGSLSVEKVVHKDKTQEFLLDIKLSDKAGNSLQVTEEGLYVPNGTLTEGALDGNWVRMESDRAIIFLDDVVDMVRLPFTRAKSLGIRELILTRASGVTRPLKLEWDYQISVNSLPGPDVMTTDPVNSITLVQVPDTQEWVALLDSAVSSSDALRAKAWAESPVTPDPLLSGSRSAKSWALEAERHAADTEQGLLALGNIEDRLRETNALSDLATQTLTRVQGEVVDTINSATAHIAIQRTATELARAQAEAARDSTITAGAWTYMPATVAAMNAITGMANQSTALVLDTMEGYRYASGSWQPLGIILGNVNQLKEELQNVWSTNPGVLRRLSFERICTISGKRLPQSAGEVAAKLQDLTTGYVSAVIPVTAGQCFRITYRNIADNTPTQGRVKVAMTDAEGTPIGILVDAGISVAHVAGAAVNVNVANLTAERTQYEYFRVPQDGFMRVSCQATQRAFGYVDEITEDLWVEQHITTDKALLRRALRDPNGVVAPLRDYTMAGIAPVLSSIPAGVKYISGMFGGFVNDIRNRGVRILRDAAVRVSDVAGYMPGSALTVLDGNANLGAQQYYNMPVAAGDEVQLLFTLADRRVISGNSTFFLLHRDPVIASHTGPQSVSEGHPIRIGRASVGVRKATIDGIQFPVPYLSNDAAGANYSTAPFRAKKGEVLRLEYSVDATQTGAHGVIYTPCAKHTTELQRHLSTAGATISEFDVLRPVPLEHPGLLTVAEGTTHNTSVVFVPMEDDGWVSLRSRQGPNTRVSVVTVEEAIAEVTSRWKSRPITETDYRNVLGYLGTWTTANGHSYATLGIFPVFKGYILSAKVNAFTAASTVVRSVGYGSAGRLPTLGVHPGTSDAFSSRFYTQAEPGYENTIPPTNGVGPIAANGEPHYFMGDVNGYMSLGHSLLEANAFPLSAVSVEYIKYEDFFAKNGWRELNPTGAYSDGAQWFYSNGSIYRVGRGYDATLNGIAGYVPHIPMRKGDIVHVRHNTGRGAATTGGFYYWDKATKTRKAVMAGDNRYQPNAIYHPGEYFYIAPEDGTLVLGWAGTGAVDAVTGLRPWGMLRPKPSYRFIDRAEYDANMKLVESREVHLPIDGELVVNFVNTALPSRTVWVEEDRRRGFVQFIHNGKLLFTAILETAIQGQSSALDRKTNYDIKLYNAKRERIMIQVGDWLPTNKLVLKGYMLDQTAMRDPLCVKLYGKIRETRPYPHNLHVDPRVLDQMDTFPLAKRAGQMSATSRGRPVLFALGGQVIGQWTLREKKDEPNYGIQVGNPDHIWMQSDYQNANGVAGEAVDWHKFLWNSWECAHPETPSHLPPEDPAVVAKIERFFNWTKAVHEGTVSLAATHQDYINLDLWIDYIVFADLIGGWDNWRNNIIISCVDGLHWSIHPYDMNMTIGFSHFSTQTTNGEIPLVSIPFIANLRALTGAESVPARWAALRNSGVISEGNFIKVMTEYQSTISERALANDKVYHYVPAAGLSRIDKVGDMVLYIRNRIAYIDGLYGYTGS